MKHALRYALQLGFTICDLLQWHYMHTGKFTGKVRIQHASSGNVSFSSKVREFTLGGTSTNSYSINYCVVPHLFPDYAVLRILKYQLASH